MALIKCKECGEKISKKAEACPHCGNPLKKKGGWTTVEWFTVIFVAPIGIFIVYGMFSLSTVNYDYQDTAPKKTTPSTSPAKQSTDWKNQRGNTRYSYSIAQDFVKKQLKAPSTVKWPGIFESKDHVKSIGNQQYQIDSWVDAENSFGAMIRNHYVAVVKQTGEYEWILVSLKFQE